jgi:Tfp pilus assembly protein PilN
LLSPIKRDKPKRKLEQWVDDFAFKRSKALDIDFARHNAQPIWSTRQLFVMSVLSAALLLTNYVYLDVQVGSVQSQLDEAKGQQTARKGKRGASDGDERQNAELANARQIVANLNRPWERLFVAIEAATNSDVTLLDITPNPQGGDLHVSGDARNFKSVLAFVQALKEQGAATQDLSQVYLASHQVQEQDPLRTIRFEVNASWRPKDVPFSDTGVNSPKATDINTEIVGLGGVDAQQTIAHLEGSR